MGSGVSVAVQVGVNVGFTGVTVGVGGTAVRVGDGACVVEGVGRIGVYWQAWKSTTANIFNNTNLRNLRFLSNNG